MQLLQQVTLLTAPYDSYPLECDGLTRVLQTVLSRAGIPCRVYGGHVIYHPTGEQTPTHMWLVVDTEQGSYFLDYRLRLWLRRGQDQ